jgi:fructose-1,6-bisphosphatase/inositol monophosphatase family enzyme
LIGVIPDLEQVAAIMREVARDELLSRFQALAKDEIWEKARGGTVTTADMESERRLKSALSEMVSGSVVLAEEEAEENPASIDCLQGDAPVWIVDPLDGTRNFAGGNDTFAMIVAYFDRGAVRAGWILEPVTGRMAVAAEGAGAWNDDGPLKASSSAPTEQQTGFLGNRIRRNEEVAARFGELVNLRCRGIEYMALASGRLDFAHYRSLKPWDHAAGDLIVREAGGYVAGFDSAARYQPAAPDYNGLLVASDENSWREIADLLRPAVAALG